MQQGVKDFGVTIGSRMIVILVSVATQSCLAWWLGPSLRGSLAVCMVFVQLLTVLFLLGCDVAGGYFLASRRMSISQAVAGVMSCAALGWVLAIVAGAVLVQFDWTWTAKAPRSAFYLALVTLPLGSASSILLVQLNAVRAFSAAATIWIQNVLLQLVGTVILVGVLGWQVQGALIANGIAFAAAIMTASFILRRRHGLQWRLPQIASMRAVFGYGVRYYLGKISNLANFQMGTILLAAMASDAEMVGIFAVAANLVMRIDVIPTALQSVIIPRVASDEAGRPELVARCVRVTFVVVGLPLLALALLAGPVVVLLFGPGFAEAAPLVRIIALGVWIRASCKLFTPYLVGTNRPGLASIAVAVGMVVNLVLVLALFDRFGMVGAAWALTIGYGVSSTMLAWWFVRLSEMRAWEVFRFRGADIAPLVERFRARAAVGAAKTGR